MFCVVLLVVLCSGCGQEAETVEQAVAEPEPQLVEQAQPEEYVEVDPSELAFMIEDFYYDGVVGPDGMEPIGGEVGRFTCEGQVLELTSPEFVDGFIETKEYGRIKVRFTTQLGGGSFAVWLTPTQKQALLALRKS
jgi:hypothetical protein